MLNKVIRKISVGSDVNNQLHISVGSSIGGNIVDTIRNTSPGCYEIWTSSRGTQDVSLWKKVEKMPTIIEYNTRLS